MISFLLFQFYMSGSGDILCVVFQIFLFICLVIAQIRFFFSFLWLPEAL